MISDLGIHMNHLYQIIQDRLHKKPLRFRLHQETSAIFHALSYNLYALSVPQFEPAKGISRLETGYAYRRVGDASARTSLSANIFLSRYLCWAYSGFANIYR